VNYELVINTSTKGRIEIALLKDKKLIELHYENGSNNYVVGDVYFGTVFKLMTGLNAAFIDVGHEKDAFLHYLDLGPKVKSVLKFSRLLRNNLKQTDFSINNDVFEEEIEKTGKITQVLKRSLQIPVQVTKEPISNKGPRLTTQISLAGRYVVLMPFDNRISISRKIAKQEERNKLKKIVQSIIPANFGAIIRTVAEGQSVEEIENDLKDLIAKWDQMCSQLKTAVAPQKILGESDRTLTLVRDLVNSDFTSIHVDDPILEGQISSYLKSKSDEFDKLVKLHKNKTPIFQHFGIDKQIKSSFGKEVSFMGGCYLIIEHTEALHVIDINSGSISKANINQEENALKVNLEACEEIARQLRLRDIGGIIVLDLIDLKTAGNRKLVYEKLKEEMKSDRAKHKILPMSPFGLIQITRQRVRPEMAISTVEKCPTCNGSGEIQTSDTLIDDIENKVKYLIENMQLSKFTIEANPFVAAFLTRGLISKRMSWYYKFKKYIKIKSNDTLPLVDYRFLNSDGEKIEL